MRELCRCGITFGSHTVTHRDLRKLQQNEFEGELALSKEIIENRVGKSINSFSYPYAFPEVNREFKRALRQALVRCGYKNGVSTLIGAAKQGDDVFFLKRIPVNSYDDMLLFRAKLAGDYDWLIYPQRLYKFLYKFKDRSSLKP